VSQLVKHERIETTVAKVFFLSLSYTGVFHRPGGLWWAGRIWAPGGG
jgi:hypothetical protein